MHAHLRLAHDSPPTHYCGDCGASLDVAHVDDHTVWHDSQTAQLAALERRINSLQAQTQQRIDAADRSARDADRDIEGRVNDLERRLDRLAP